MRRRDTRHGHSVPCLGPLLVSTWHEAIGFPPPAADPTEWNVIRKVGVVEKLDLPPPRELLPNSVRNMFDVMDADVRDMCVEEYPGE